MRSRYVAVACLLLSLARSGPAFAQLRPVTLVTGLAQPVAFIQDPADPAVQFVLQQAGLIRVVRNGVLQATPFLDLRALTTTDGERGLLGMAFPPNAVTTGRAFIFFTNLNGDIVVARFTRAPGNSLVADPNSRFDLRWSTGLRVIRHPTFANHNGGTLQFGPDGYLYVGTGDGGSANDPANNAQNMSSLLGKMLRIDVSVPDSDAAGMRVPPDNPFPASGAPEIWDIGLRNPWKYSFDDPSRGGTGALIIGDVGQGAWEEVDYEPPARGGNNYGWRNREGAHDNDTSVPPTFQPLVDPTFEYPHPTGNSITGGYVYRGSALGPAYRGRYFFADFVAKKIWSLALTINPSTGGATASDLREHTAELSPGNVSSFGIDAAGELYFVDYAGGTITRIDPVAPLRPPAVVIDQPTVFQTRAQPFLLGGWAVDPGALSGAGVDTIHVWAVPITSFGGTTFGTPVFVAAASLTVDRPDVAAFFGSSQFTRCGFQITVTGLAPGAYRFIAFALVHRTGSFDVATAVDVAIVSRVLIAVDLPARGAAVGAPFVIGGWAIDAAAPAGTGIDAVHVWAAPISTPGPVVFLGAATTFIDRPDVGALFGAQFTHSGYGIVANLPSPGVWDIYVFARSPGTNSFQLAPPVRVTR